MLSSHMWLVTIMLVRLQSSPRFGWTVLSWTVLGWNPGIHTCYLAVHLGQTAQTLQA